MKRTEMSVWVPTIICEEDTEFNVSIQDLMDCVLASRESALEFVEELKTRFIKEWSELDDVSPYCISEDETEEENCGWYGWEFTWTTPDNKKYKCVIFLQLTPIYC